MKNYAEILAAKVRARNKCHEVLNRVVPMAIEALRPFIGLDVQLKGYGLKKQLRDAIDPITSNGTGMWPLIRFDSSRYSISVSVKICEMIHGDHGCVYAEESAMLGEVNGGILTKLYEAYVPRREDHTADEIVMIRKQLDGMRSRMSELSSKLMGFGEHDNS